LRRSDHLSGYYIQFNQPSIIKSEKFEFPYYRFAQTSYLNELWTIGSFNSMEQMISAGEHITCHPIATLPSANEMSGILQKLWNYHDPDRQYADLYGHLTGLKFQSLQGTSRTVFRMAIARHHHFDSWHKLFYGGLQSYLRKIAGTNVPLSWRVCNLFFKKTFTYSFSRIIFYVAFKILFYFGALINFSFFGLLVFSIGRIIFSILC